MENNSKRCRVCLKVEKPRKLTSLFDKKTNKAEQILLIAGIQVNDGYKKLLPNKICFKCSDALSYAAQIRSLCLDSDRLLKKQLSDLNLMKNEIKFELGTINEPVFYDDTYEEVYLEKEELDADLDHIQNDEIVDEFTPETITVNEPKNITDGIREDDKFSASFKIPLCSQKVNRLSTSRSKVCEICGKYFAKGYLSHHLKTHNDLSNAEKYSCDLCSLSFKLKCYLYSHMINIHVGVKKWNCKICDRSYSKKNTLLIHERSHTAEGYTFKCTYDNCGKTFTRPNKLKVHTRIHTNERPYTCSYCQRTFIHYTDHKRHVMGHTGERPYKCTLQNCSRGFIKKSQLTAHERTHQLA